MCSAVKQVGGFLGSNEPLKLITSLINVGPLPLITIMGTML